MPTDFARFRRPAALVATLAAACAGAGVPFPAGATVDFSQRLEANSIGFQLSNVGSFGYNVIISDAGLEFPRTTGRHALFAGGLWLGAKVAGGTRVTLSDYGFDYAPGPMSGGTFLPDNARFRVYKVSAGDTTGTAAWMADAVPLGAPTSAGGTAPGRIGAQTLWAVYNDADASRHTTQAGRTAPLGVEVRQTAWEHTDPGVLDRTVFLRFQIRNAGSATLDSLYVGLWGDPDLGGAGDDLIGTDSARDMAYVYNATNTDPVYPIPPALAYVLLQGPRLTPGANPMHATALNAYIGGDDPANATETYRLLRGLKRNGNPWINPNTNLATTFPYSGDPVTGTGWLQPNVTDQKFLIACGPLTMAPGESQDVLMAIVIALGFHRLDSISLLRNSVDALFQTVSVPPAPAPSSPRLFLAPLASPAVGPVRIRLRASAGAAWRLDVFDVQGRRVATPARGEGTGGEQAATWNPSGDRPVDPGVYWVTLRDGSDSVAQRVVVLAR